MKIPAAQNQAARRIIILLCCVAMTRVFVFSAAFPFFSVVDEQSHFDVVTRYSHASPPRAMLHTSEEALPYIMWFSTSEYIFTPESQPHGMFLPPPWMMTKEEAAARLAPRESYWRDDVVNCENGQPPLYYAIAGGWWRIGQWLPLTAGDRLLWLRLLNAIFLAGLVWLGGVAAQRLFPEKRFIQFAVPALIAFFPQPIFYAINNDALSPLVFGVAFVLLLDFWCAENPCVGSSLVTGLALAATFLTKMSNLPLLVVAGIFLVLKIFQLTRNEKLRSATPAIAVLALGAGLPMAGWLVWSKINFGDFTGAAEKIRALKWTDQPLAVWFHHPIFTPHGFWYFLKGNLASFWYGENLWHRAPLTSPTVNLLVVVLSLVALFSALAGLLRRASLFIAPQRVALWFCFACLAALFVFYALLSVKYDFHDCFYPSREAPYFVSGRLMLGALIPFLLLFTCGLDRLMSRFQERTKFMVLGVFLVFLLVSELAINLPVFYSEYNWYHF